MEEQTIRTLSEITFMGDYLPNIIGLTLGIALFEALTDRNWERVLEISFFMASALTIHWWTLVP